MFSKNNMGLGCQKKKSDERDVDLKKLWDQDGCTPESITGGKQTYGEKKTGLGSYPKNIYHLGGRASGYLSERRCTAHALLCNTSDYKR